MEVSYSDWIQIIIAFITFMGIIVSLIISIITLIQNRNIIENSNKADLIFYIDYNPQISTYFLIIKNFGNSVGKLISLEVTPKLDWKKTKFKQDLVALTEARNILLAPNQKVSSWFDFKGYPDNKFSVKIEYSSNNKIYRNEYSIDLNYINNVDWLTQYAFDDTSKDNKEALYKINNSIRDLTDKFR